MRKVTLILCLMLVVMAIATPPTGGGRTLIFSTFSNGGTENAHARSSTRYLLSDNLGNGVSASDTRLENGSYHLYGGFRNVDLDLRAPITVAETEDSVVSSSRFHVNWGGTDTNVEDGEGWGIWKYDIQWSKSSDPGVWHDWHTETELEADWFGPDDPTTVMEDTLYFFRVRAYDYVENLEDYPAGYDSRARYQPSTLDYTVKQTDDSDTWVISGEAPGDTVDQAEESFLPAAKVFIAKNNSTEAIDLGVYSFDSEPQDTLSGVWSLMDYPGLDAFALRAIFNDSPVPPAAFDFEDTTTFVRGNDVEVRYGDTYFGPGGYNIQNRSADPSDSTAFTDNLWLNFEAPTWVTRYGGFETELINIRIEARTSVY